MNPGPELDALVAEAIGYTITRSPATGRPFRSWPKGKAPGTPLEVTWNKVDLDVHDVPKYSTDWNAAMQAAEAVGLFKSNELCQTEDGQWQCGHFNERGVSNNCCTETTGQHAICLAILKLKEKP